MELYCGRLIFLPVYLNIYLGNIKGAKKLVEHLASHGVPIGLVSNATENSYKYKLDTYHLSLLSLFKYKTFGPPDPMVERCKPYPDMFVVAANRFPVKPEKPERCLVFEDGVNGLLAARAAGMQVVLLPDSRIPKINRCYFTKATVVLQSFKDFKPEEFGLPKYKVAQAKKKARREPDREDSIPCSTCSRYRTCDRSA